MTDIGDCEGPGGPDDVDGCPNIATNRIGDVFLCDRCLEAGGGDAGWPVSVGSISITRGADRVEIAWNGKPILGVTAEGAVGTWDADGEWRELFSVQQEWRCELCGNWNPATTKCSCGCSESSWLPLLPAYRHIERTPS